MKIRTILLTVLMTLIIASAAFADTAYFTCDSDPADFNGKTFDGLNILLKGCQNFDNPDIPGNDVFLTLSDIRVNDLLTFNDDSYDPETDTWTDSPVPDNATHDDHYLNIVGNSYIGRIWMENHNPHDVYLGVQFPTWINELDVDANQPESVGKIVIRGYIDPLVGQKANYKDYERTAVSTDFDPETFDLDFVKPALDNFEEFEFDSYLFGESERYGGIFYSPYSLLRSGLISSDIWPLCKRGYIDMMFVQNSYNAVNVEPVIELSNIEINLLGIDVLDNELSAGIDLNSWKPVIRSRGYTTIAHLMSSRSFKTEAGASAPYSVSTRDEVNAVLPLYIDLMTLGGPGREISYNMENTRIAMLNYTGEEDPASKLKLRTGKISNLINMPIIGIMNVFGGYFDLSSTLMYREIPTIEKLNFFEGKDDFRWTHDGTPTLRPGYALKDLYGMDNSQYEVVFATNEENLSNKQIRENWEKLYYSEYGGDGNIPRLYTFPHTAEGYFNICYALENIIKPGSTDMKGKSVVGFNGQNISLGDIGVSKNLDPIISWMSGSCNFAQHGEQRLEVLRIE